ncbi:protein hypothetical protein [Limosa lapponica baueri]|uniref:B box-type domain-containing protein n=1 Tax=Limosa lapponica baueri TaxID=1758121 RepID=A0A2I0TAR3_LIMLA|nr:protein hypothetical protein [Limosa lapponica baueri]
MDNLLFTSLQARLETYKKIVDGVDLFCGNCKKAGEFWCPECEEFLCTRCFEAHQHYLKRESHKAMRVRDIRAWSAKDFLKGTRKTSNLSCPNPTHKSQIVRSIHDSLASLQQDFGGWARSNMQQADELLKVSDRLLQAQLRANRHLVSVTQEIQAVSRSMATITSAMGPLLQPMASPREPLTADMDWPSLPSDLLELFPPSTPQEHGPLVPVATVVLSPSRPSPAAPSASPVRSEPHSPASEGEGPKSRGKRGGKPSTRLQKRRKK